MGLAHHLVFHLERSRFFAPFRAVGMGLMPSLCCLILLRPPALLLLLLTWCRELGDIDADLQEAESQLKHAEIGRDDLVKRHSKLKVLWEGLEVYIQGCCCSLQHCRLIPCW